MTLLCCRSQRSLSDSQIVVVEGKVIIGQPAEAVIGQKIIEHLHYDNFTQTDTTGFFKIQLQGDLPIFVLSGFYEPIYVELDPDEFNTIIIGDALFDKSRDVLKTLDTIK